VIKISISVTPIAEIKLENPLDGAMVGIEEFP
jgi:hypothetical protein